MKRWILALMLAVLPGLVAFEAACASEACCCEGAESCPDQGCAMAPASPAQARALVESGPVLPTLEFSSIAVMKSNFWDPALGAYSGSGDCVKVQRGSPPRSVLVSFQL